MDNQETEKRMWNLNYDSPKELAGVLAGGDLAMTKRFGQNFLISPQARERIASLTGAGPGMTVWEIGPGLGAITSRLLLTGAKVKCFEIDHGFCRILRGDAFADEEGFSLVEGDCLKTLFKQKGELPDVICGNLPYNVGSVAVAKLIEEGMTPPRMVFTMQKEVVERMCASPGDERYSSFSVVTQLDYSNKIAFTIPRTCFFPQPKVESAVVVMEKLPEPRVRPEIRNLALELNRDLFSQRRKTMKNNLLSGSLGKRKGREAVLTTIEKAGFTGLERAETLGFDELVRLAEAVESLG